MILKKYKELELYHFDRLLKFTEILHFSTTRNGGLSNGKYRSLNLGTNSGDDPAVVYQNREILAGAIGINLEQMIFPKQTHGDTVLVIDSADKPEHAPQNTDAIITNQPGICIQVKTADCVPVFLYDPVENAIGIVHAGWRGTVKNITGKTVQKMVSVFNSKPENILAGIGPSIGPEKYLVGEDVIEEVMENLPEPMNLLKIAGIGYPEAMYLNLWEANKQCLLEEDILEENIEIGGLCTHSNEEYFYSARRDGSETGRMANGIMLLKS